MVFIVNPTIKTICTNNTLLFINTMIYSANNYFMIITISKIIVIIIVIIIKIFIEDPIPTDVRHVIIK
jgi:hypothetical protein